MSSTIIPFIICSSIVVIFYFTFYYILNRKATESLKQLAGYLNKSIVKFTLTPTLNGEYEGSRFSIIFVPPSKSSPAYLKISLIKNSIFKLNIYKARYEGLMIQDCFRSL